MRSPRSPVIVASLVLAVLAANAAALLAIRAHRFDIEASRLRAELDDSATRLKDAAAKVDALQGRTPLAVDKLSIAGPWKVVNKDPTCQGWTDNTAACAALAEVINMSDSTLYLGTVFGTLTLTRNSPLEFSASTEQLQYATCKSVELGSDLKLTLKVTELANRPDGTIVARKLVGSFTVTVTGGGCDPTKDVRDFEATLVGS